jgi:hypothetical protein
LAKPTVRVVENLPPPASLGVFCRIVIRDILRVYEKHTQRSTTKPFLP